MWLYTVKATGHKEGAHKETEMQDTMIVRDSAGSLYEVTEPRTSGLEHCWMGRPVKRVKGGYDYKRTSSAGHARLIRKAGCVVVKS
jgi:hypothetical protein